VDIVYDTETSFPGPLLPYRVMRGCSPPVNPNTFAPTSDGPTLTPTTVAPTATPPTQAPITVTPGSSVPMIYVYGLGGVLGTAILSLSIMACVFRRRSWRLQKHMDAVNSFHKATRSPGMIDRLISKRNNDTASGEQQNDSHGSNYISASRAPGKALRRLTARLSQHLQGFSVARTSVNNVQHLVDPDQMPSGYAANPVMSREYTASWAGVMSANNPQYSASDQ
jgi:hypothetical protein